MLKRNPDLLGVEMINLFLKCWQRLSKPLKKYHLAKWAEACKPKRLGGLGMGCLKERNMALLRKWLWRFLDEGGSLCHSIISCRYGLGSNGVDCNSRSSCSMSLIWKNVIKIFPLFSPNTRFVIGGGLSIRFWKDL